MNARYRPSGDRAILVPSGALVVIFTPSGSSSVATYSGGAAAGAAERTVRSATAREQGQRQRGPGETFGCQATTRRCDRNAGSRGGTRAGQRLEREGDITRGLKALARLLLQAVMHDPIERR